MHAELAIDYFLARSLDAEEQLLNSTVKQYEQALELIESRFAGGIASEVEVQQARTQLDRKSTRLNSSHGYISYAVFCLKKKKTTIIPSRHDRITLKTSTEDIIPSLHPTASLIASHIPPPSLTLTSSVDQNIRRCATAAT